MPLGWLIAGAVAAIVAATAAVVGTFVDENTANKNAANQAEGDYNQATSDAEIEQKTIDKLKGKKTDIADKYSLLKEGEAAKGIRDQSEANAQAGASGFAFSGLDRNRESSIQANVDAKVSILDQNENTALNDVQGDIDIANAQLDQYNKQATFANNAYTDATNFDFFDLSTWGNGAGKSLKG